MGVGAAVASAAEARFLSLSKAKICTSILGVRVTYNVQIFNPNVWRPNRVLLSVLQIDLSACADRKMVNLHVCMY